MNRIILNRPMLLNKKYVVYFDSDNKFSFNNRREASDFIVRVGREIEQAVLFITEKFTAIGIKPLENMLKLKKARKS